MRVFVSRQVVVIVSMLAFMWVGGETIFIIRNRRDKEAESEELTKAIQARQDKYQQQTGNTQPLVALPTDDDGVAMQKYPVK